MPKSGFVTWEAFNAHKDKDWRTVHHLWPNIRGVTVAPRPKGSVGAHTHVKTDITDTPWAWADVLKTGSNLTDLATRQHAGLTDVTSDQHHPQSHTLASHSTKPHSALTDVLENQHHNKLHSMTGVQHSAAGLTVGHVLRATAADAFAWGFLTKLGTVSAGVWQGTPIANAYVAGIDQNLLQASSPTFATAKLTALTDGYIPYHVSDAAGLANSPIFINGANVGIGTASPLTGVRQTNVGTTMIDSHYGQLALLDDAAIAAGIGGLQVFGGKYTGTTYTTWAGIAGLKENAEDGQYSGYLALYTRSTGAMAERVRIDSTGKVIVSGLTANQLLGAGADKELKCLTAIAGLTIGHVLKATGAAAIAFQANNLAGLSDITLGTPEEASLLAYNQAEGFWYAGKPEYDIRYRSYLIDWEFWTASPPSPWVYGAITGGTATGVAATSHHPGSIGVYSGAAANSGYYWIAANNNLILSGVEQADFTFKTPAAWANRMVRFGFQDSVTIALPTDGVYLNLNGRNMTGVTRAAAAQSNTGTSYNVNAGTWYRARIIVNSDATLVTFLLYDAAGNQLWTDNLAANIPGASTGFGVLGYYTAAADGTHIITMDLAYLVCARGLVR